MHRLLRILWPVFFIFAGCGYTTGSLLPANYRTIYVEPFKNKVQYISDVTRALYVPLLETKVRTAVINRFQFDGHLKIKDSERADLVLKGDLIEFNREELRTTEAQEVQEYRIRIVMSLTMMDAVSGEPFWSEPSFAGEATYFTTGAQARSESAALDDALTDLARRVVERTIENW
ncbi:MAG: hypothetical protein HYZ86_01500 [Candidatus Omnitrophica bacterium]|nr:hypothetical protein [Candidatus Omnitrophota bacterium]